jgi:hypothetical protein
MFDIPCRSCGGHRVEMVLDLGPQPHCNRLVRPGEPDPPHYPLRLGFCLDCTLVQIDHTIPKEEMFRDYPYVSGTTETLVEHFRDTTNRLAKSYEVKPGDLVVDIGSNDGTFLKTWEGQANAIGFEPDEKIAQIAIDDGAYTFNLFFDEKNAGMIKRQWGPAKIITAAGVFFHLEDLHSVVRGCELLLADEGVLIVQAIYLGDMIANTAFDQIYHEHLCYYTLRSISALLEPHGLEVFDCVHLPIHGGTMEYHIARIGARREQPEDKVKSRCYGVRGEEALSDLGEIETYRDFAGRVTALRGDLLKTLYQYRAAGKTVWAYGAPAKGATLLNSFGIGRDLVRCATEKNPLKRGMDIPGCRIPIISEQRYGPPDAYLVLAWNFLDEFIAKERMWLRAGGEFIVPVPTVRVIRGGDV